MANDQHSLQDDLRLLHEAVEKLQSDHHHSQEMKTAVVDQFAAKAQDKNRPQQEVHDTRRHDEDFMDQRARH